MTLTILTAAGIALAVIAVYAVITNARPVEALAGETTLANAHASAETIATGRHHASPAQLRTEWNLTTVAALCDAEDLLDVLENQGVEERELVVLGNSCFAVRWR